MLENLMDYATGAILFIGCNLLGTMLVIGGSLFAIIAPWFGASLIAGGIGFTGIKIAEVMNYKRPI